MFRLDPFALSAEYVEQVLPLATVKAHLAIDADEDEFDLLLAVYSAAAVDAVERYCGLAMGPKVEAVLRAETLPDPLWLPGPNVVLTSIDYLDSAGAAQAVDVATLRTGTGGAIVPKPGQAWPGDIAAGVVVTFDAGYPEGECPPALVQAALLFVAHLFLNREAVQASGAIGGELPLGFTMLCGQYRMPVI